MANSFANAFHPCPFTLTLRFRRGGRTPNAPAQHVPTRPAVACNRLLGRPPTGRAARSPPGLRLLHRRAELQVMTVRVGEVERPRRHPLVEHGSVDSDTSLLEVRRGRLDIRFFDPEGKMLCRPSPLDFLQHHHPVCPPSPKDHHVPTSVPMTTLEPQDLAL